MGISEWMIDKLAPAAPEPAPAVPTEERGNTGVTDSGGFVIEEGRQPGLTGGRRQRLIDEMMTNVSIVAAGIRLYLYVLSKAEWTVNAAEDQEDNQQAQDIATSAYDMMFDMKTPWANIVRKLGMFRFYGFALMEWYAKRRPDGQIGIANAAHRPQRTIVRWDLDEHGEVVGCWQSAAGRPEIYLARDRLIYAVDDSLTELPQGMGLFDHLVWVTGKLDEFYKLETIGFQSDLRGFPVAFAPLGELEAKAETKARVVNGVSDGGKAWLNSMLSPVKKFVANHIKSFNQGAMLDSETYRSQTADGGAPSGTRKWGLELLTGDASSFDAVAAAINRETEAAARIIGCEHLLLGKGGEGSLALSKTKQSGFYLSVTSALGDLVEIVERDWVGPIARLNGWAEDLIPSVAVEAISDVDLEQIAEALAKIAQAGGVLMPDDPAIGELRDMMGLSRPPEDGLAMDSALHALEPEPAPVAPVIAEPIEKRARVRQWIVSDRSKRRMAKRAMAQRG